VDPFLFKNERVLAAFFEIFLDNVFRKFFINKLLRRNGKDISLGEWLAVFGTFLECVKELINK
jgi:hypothetical protein